LPCVDAVVAFVGQLLAFVSLAFAELRVKLTLVGPALAECLLVGAVFRDIRVRLALAGDPVAFVGQLLAFVGYPVAFVSLAFADLRVNFTLVGQALAQCLLVGPALPGFRLRVALVGHPVPFVGQLVAFVGQALAFVGLAFSDLRVNLTLVGPYFASADFRISVRHASTVVPAERQAEERT
jgi:hypothetical protein